MKQSKPGWKKPINFIVLVFIFVSCGHKDVASSSYARVDSDLQANDKMVAKMKADFAQQPSQPQDVTWVKKKLQHMVEVDQYMRQQSDLPFLKKYNAEETAYFWKEMGARFKQVDAENTKDLKELLRIYSWFVISKFGKDGDNNAWLLVQHADDQPDFQKQVLVILAGLYKNKETNPRNYAYLYDRVAASFSDLSLQTLQRYGTQGSCTGPGKWEPIPMENPSQVDIRRAEVGLETMAEYILKFKNICH